MVNMIFKKFVIGTVSDHIRGEVMVVESDHIDPNIHCRFLMANEASSSVLANCGTILSDRCANFNNKIV